MNANPSINLHQTALDCVESMGDILWDFKPERDTPLQFRDPYEIAVETVEDTLRVVVADVVSVERGWAALRAEYAAIIADLAASATDATTARALVQKAEWTEKGAREIVQLARRYGTSVLRNALALAEAMNIEDGEAGL